LVNELLRIAGRADVPVLTGLGKPLAPGRNGVMFGHEGIGLLENPAPRIKTESDPNPEERISAMAEALANSGAECMLAIGPMTNLGALTNAGVELPPLTIMGGKIEDVEIPGTHPGIPEWNWYSDPAAVSLTLAAAGRVPPRIVPIEVTWPTALAEGDLGLLEQGDDLSRVLAVLGNEWLIVLRDKFGMKVPKIALHDPLALATMLVADLCPFEERMIRVDEKGFSHREAGGARVSVATSVENEALRDHLMEIWSSGDPD
jgi:purine nucleosidase